MIRHLGHAGERLVVLWCEPLGRALREQPGETLEVCKLNRNVPFLEDL